jgi:hypothetical protein
VGAYKRQENPSNVKLLDDDRVVEDKDEKIAREMGRTRKQG